MATGDQKDMLARIKATLPKGWFPDTAPVLDGLLSGPAQAWSWCYSLIQYTKAQTRRLTATGFFLDLIAQDFFGTWIKRRVNETDASLSARIGKELFREKGTRAGLCKALTDLTGRAPIVFEPAYTHDTGGYSIGCGYGAGGGYGNLKLPFQFFVTAYRPAGLGVANVAPYGNRTSGPTGVPGGYGSGAIEYANPTMYVAPVTDADILNVINDVRPAATIAWTHISS